MTTNTMKLLLQDLLESSSSFVYSAVVTVGLGLAGTVLLLFYTKRSESADNSITHLVGSSRSSEKLSPPRAKLGLLGCIKMMTSEEKPFKLLKLAEELDSFLFELDWNALFGVPKYIVIGEPKLARQILTDPLTTKPPQIYRAMEKLSGKQSMFSSNGEFWHSRRSGMMEAFSSKHIKRMNAVAARKTEVWIETRLSKFIENDQAFDVGKEMINIVFDSIIETSFEYQIGNIERDEFMHDLNACLKEFTSKEIGNPFRKVFGLFFAERRRVHISKKRVQKFAVKMMEQHRQLQNPLKDTILDKILSNDAYENDKERVADIILLIVAGFDTTAHTITWILKELAKNAKEQKELRESLNSLSKEEQRRSVVLRKIVKECMRLNPVAAGGPKRIIGRNIEIDGTFLPKGSIVDMPLILLLRNSNIFKDADSFCPSRWDNPTKEMNEAFFPFGLGKQNCIGQSLANAEIYSLIPQICSEFELELVDEGKTIFFLTLKPENVMIKAKKVS